MNERAVKAGGWREKLALLKNRLLSFADIYSRYYGWLISFGLLAWMFGSLAYRFNDEHFWFHVCVELSVAMLMLLLAVIVVERMLEYRQEQERKERWALIRDDTLRFLQTSLVLIVRTSANDLIETATAPIGSNMEDVSSASYQVVEQGLKKQCEALKEAGDPQAMEALADKIIAWHAKLTPVFNLLRMVTVPAFFAQLKEQDFAQGFTTA